MVKSVIDGIATYYPGRHYNQTVNGATVTIQKYYTFGAQAIAMRVNGTLTWQLSDHLGSTSLTLDASANITAELRYTAFGETRTESASTPTNYRYTGQLQQAGIGLYYYGARWYDPAIDPLHAGKWQYYAPQTGRFLNQEPN